MQSLRQFDDNYKVLEGSFDFDDRYWQSWLESEGFEHINGYWEDSYGFVDNYPSLKSDESIRTNYWYWSKCLDCFIFRIYVFRNCVVIDKDWDCGGNAGGRVYEFEYWSIEEIWDQIIEYIKLNVQS
jgi:hypothetical protein